MIFWLAALAVQGETLNLRCEGHRMVMAAAGATSGSAFDNRGNVVVGGATNLVPTEVPSVAEFRMSNGKAELRLPPEAQPIMAFSGPKGWMPVKDLAVTDREIAGRLRFGIGENVRFTIDRVDGALVTPAGRFHCQPVDATQRAF